MHILPSVVLLLVLLAPLLAERQITGQQTAYGWCDNDPPGNSISKPGTFHSRAEQGDGSYDNPSTCAADPSRVAYDWCAACVQESSRGNTRIDLWIGVKHGCGSNVEEQCEDRVTQLSTTLYLDANRGHPVNTQRLFDGTHCAV